MNEQTSKKIVFNRSTLFSLKAELLKKQEEVHEKKQLPQHKIEHFKPPPAKQSDQNEGKSKVYKKTFKDSLKEIDVEELEACRKAKLALEKKAELYEHLSDGAGSSQLAGRFLVDFKTKKQQEDEEKKELDTQPISDIYTNVTNVALDSNEDESDWTEFTDCLGRTRRCLKSDLEFYMKRDRELIRITTGKDYDQDPNESKEPVQSEKPLLVQKTNDYLMSLREKWEQKEKELLAKDKDIHYQDILFDEARMHGVSYYSFSTDDTERNKQMEDLMKRREETIRAQQEAEEKRKKRDELMAARVAAARARQRARAGLPPEEPKENTEDFTAKLLEFLTQQKNEADAKATEEEKKAKEEKEKERQKLREAYVREWDVGKEGVDSKVKKFREMTQEEYVEQQRAKRIDEFAPKNSGQSSSINDYTFDNRGKAKYSDETGDPKINKSWSDVRPKAPTPPPPDIGDLSEISINKGLYFSTNKKFDIKYKNFVKAQEPSPIINELEYENVGDDRQRSEKRKYDTNHTQIPPPPTYEYYGPIPKHSKQQKPFDSNISEAYAQGTKSLEPKTSHVQLSKQYDFTFE